MLFDSFMKGISSSFNGIEACEASCRAPAGVARPSRVGPVTFTPCAASASRKTAAAYPVGSHTLTHSVAPEPPTGVVPLTTMVLPPCSRSTVRSFEPPAATVVARTSRST